MCSSALLCCVAFLLKPEPSRVHHYKHAPSLDFTDKARTVIRRQNHAEIVFKISLFFPDGSPGPPPRLGRFRQSTRADLRGRILFFPFLARQLPCMVPPRRVSPFPPTQFVHSPSFIPCVHVHDASSFSRPKILDVAAAVERGCRHPLADAVVLAAEEKVTVSLGRSSPLHAEGLFTVPGLGASAQVQHMVPS